MTKKGMIENFPRVESERDLLQRYFWDSRAARKPAVHVNLSIPNEGRKDRFTFSVYEPTAGHGGYIVIDQQPGGMPVIHWWEQFAEDVRRMPYDGTDYTFMLKSAVEVLAREVRKAQSLAA